MPDYEFLKNPISKQWVVLAPRRASRPDEHSGVAHACPFCPGHEDRESELFRIGGDYPDQNWKVRVLPNKYPFAQYHEVILHSKDHEKNFNQLPLEQVDLILQTYRHQFKIHKKSGQVYIFHNFGVAGGESIKHPHSQLVVVPFNVQMDIPRLDPFSSYGIYPVTVSAHTHEQDDSRMIATNHFYFFCPQTSQWPDEVWIVPKERGKMYSDISDDELSDLGFVLQRVLQILNARHQNEFPFNFYIYPGSDWYLRIMPRLKSLGGFEIGTGIWVNTQDPKETIAFLKTYFENPDYERMKKEHLAMYHKAV